MPATFQKIRARDHIGRAVTGKSFAVGCAVKDTGAQIGVPRQVDECAAGGRADYVVMEEVTPTTGSIWMAGTQVAYLRLGATVDASNRDQGLAVIDAQGRWGPPSMGDKVYYVALDLGAADEYVLARPVCAEA